MRGLVCDPTRTALYPLGELLSRNAASDVRVLCIFVCIVSLCSDVGSLQVSYSSFDVPSSHNCQTVRDSYCLVLGSAFCGSPSSLHLLTWRPREICLAYESVYNSGNRIFHCASLSRTSTCLSTHRLYHKETQRSRETPTRPSWLQLLLGSAERPRWRAQRNRVLRFEPEHACARATSKRQAERVWTRLRYWALHR